MALGLSWEVGWLCPAKLRGPLPSGEKPVFAGMSGMVVLMAGEPAHTSVLGQRSESCEGPEGGGDFDRMSLCACHLFCPPPRPCPQATWGKAWTLGPCCPHHAPSMDRG